MPKKFTGENSKAAAARLRKAAQKDAEALKKEKEAEEALWKDNDKHVLKKMQRKEENEKKKQQSLEKKAEAKAILEKEMESLTVSVKQPIAKITRAEILAEKEKRNAFFTNNANKSNKPKPVVEQPLEENINKLQIEQFAENIDEAIAMLSSKDAVNEDMHPEKRMRAAYLAYEKTYLPRLKEENPTLRLTQLRQMLLKSWAKSTENPRNKV